MLHLIPRDGKKGYSMQLLLTNTPTKKITNSGPHTITSTQPFKQSTTINGVVTPHLNKKLIMNSPQNSNKGTQHK